MSYEYFVSYARFHGNGNGFGFSQAVLDVVGPMTSENLGKVLEYLQGLNPGQEVIILTFQRLEAPKTSTASV